MSSTDGITSLIQAKQTQTYAAIGIAVMRKGLDATADQGEAAVALLEAAADIARQLGKGTEFDALA